MGDVIKPGDRVRLTVHNRQPVVRPGDKGIVLEGPNPCTKGGTYYVVQIGDGTAPQHLIFMSDEIERDQ